jgi:hypothetical protein
MANGLKCGFYHDEEDESLAFYVLRLEPTESILTGEQETRFIEQNVGALSLSSMCNSLEGLHRRIAMLEYPPFQRPAHCSECSRSSGWTLCS